MPNKIAIVTGSEGEIGFQICQSLREAGFKIVGVDLHQPQRPELYEQYFQGSVVSAEVLSECLEVLNQVKPSELSLINNAGVTYPGDYSRGSWDKTLETNLTGPYFWMLGVTEYFEKTKIFGSIISITSLAAELSFPGNPAYSASKGGLRQLTKSFAHRLGPLGVCCNNVVPGYIETKFNAGSLANTEKYRNRQRHSMLGRWGQPNEIAAAVKFLCSEESRFITGQDFIVDGGWISQGLSEYE